ncbi:DUF6090 family protein [Winogradskyella vincentii]|uniref:Uncharacterized protein n=1 Tax=Winogradskyella vincentii TaxID=2877122 RepID=A0ABS7Y3B5_9FLAO|nr:DUF6090 family protein [Winogradskyella vincentii]MCA0154414.1 hypothetical protein [Winogradskyella vincentii]
MGKYFKYAIGEILLVVIGILIALQINNWNEDRKARKQEIKYLKNLQIDVLTELKNNDTIIDFRANKAKAAARLLNFKKLNTATDIFELEGTIQTVFWWTTFIPTNNTYKELLSSGNLNYLKNDSIKNYLLELDKKYVEIDNAEHHMRSEYDKYLYDVAILNGDMLNVMDLQLSAENGEILLKDPSQIPIDAIVPQYQTLLKDKTFTNGVKLSIMNNIFIKNFHVELTDHLEKLNQLIQDDLNKG